MDNKKVPTEDSNLTINPLITIWLTALSKESSPNKTGALTSAQLRSKRMKKSRERAGEYVREAQIPHKEQDCSSKLNLSKFKRMYIMKFPST